MKTQSITFNLIVLLLFSSINVTAQIVDDSFDPTAESGKLATIPNSPEAQAFTKYGNTSVNMYTGTPNIAVPIYTFKGRELDLPISLTYDASGIKVDQLATNVGLGWNLNVGGRISRLVNGYPDDFHNTGYTQQLYKSFWDSSVNADILAYDDLPSNPTFSGSSGQQNLINYMQFTRKVNINEYDSQPDFFSFNALGNSDMFTIDVSSKQPKSLNNPRIKASITKSGTGGASTPITEWEVIMDDGTIYTFEEAEITRDLNLDDQGASDFFGYKKEYNSSWLVTKIESANGKDVYEFSYTDLGFWTSNREGSTLDGVTNVISVNSGNTPNYPTPTNPMGYTTNEYKIKQIVLDEITHNGNLIVAIDLLANRYDMTVDSAIENIHIYDHDVNDLKRSFTFVYDYFRTSSVSTPINSSTDPIFIRLKLDELLIKDSNSSTVKGYEFEYIDPYLMPSTTSNARDYFGYFNGVSNSVLYPTYSHPWVPSNGANRNPTHSKAKRGLLNKIIYPTGGHTLFDYEANYEQEVSGTSTVWQNVASTELDYPASIDFPAYNSSTCNSSTNVTPIISTDVFEVTQNSTDYKMIYDETGTINSLFPAERRATLVKIASASATLDWDEIYDNNCNIKAGVDIIWTLPFKQKVFPHTATISLDTGFYQLVLANPLTTVSNSFDAQESVIVTNYNYNEKAGIRVKDIKDYTDATTLALHKSYDYPSGTIISDPKYTYTSTQYSLDSGGSPVQSTILHRVSYASGLDKPHVGYSKVVETVEDAQGSSSNGYTEHEFYTTNAGNYKAGTYTYYINGKETAQQYGVTYQLGKSKGSTAFDNNDIIQSSTNNTYDDTEYYDNTGIYLHNDDSKSDLFPIPTHNSSLGFWYINYIPYTKVASNSEVELVTPSDCNTTNFLTASNVDDLCNPGVGRLYKQTSKAWGKAGYLTQSRSKQYYNGAVDIMEQVTDYEHDIGEWIPKPGYPDIFVPGNFLLKSTETIDSKAETIKQEYYYPESGALKDANMISTPIRTETYYDGALMAHKKTIYSGTLPSKIQIAKGSNTLEDRLLFERFEDDNVVQVKQVDGITTAYVWGYNKRYIVAKVENATYAQIEGLNEFNTFPDNGLSPAQETALRNLTNTLVTTYKYDSMVGVTEITDPTLNTIYFEYDDFHRLKQVKDKNSKILSKNEYNYKLY